MSKSTVFEQHFLTSRSNVCIERERRWQMVGARAMLFYSNTCRVRQAVNTDFPMPSHIRLNGLVIRERERVSARAGSSPLLFLRAAQTKSRRREARGIRF